MSTKPFVNALVAAGYINLFAMFVFNSPKVITDAELGMMAPILFLSLFVTSAALMGYLFFYQPVRLIVESKTQEAAKFFLTTVASFVGIIFTTLLTWYLLSTVL